MSLPQSIAELLKRELHARYVTVKHTRDLLTCYEIFEAKVALTQGPILEFGARIATEDLVRNDDPEIVAGLLLGRPLEASTSPGQLFFIDGQPYMWTGQEWARMISGSPAVTSEAEENARIAEEHEREAREIYEATRQRLLGA